MCKEAYHASTYKKCTQSLIYDIFCPFSQYFVPSKTPSSKILRYPYCNNCRDIIVVKAPCSYKSLKYSYQNY